MLPLLSNQVIGNFLPLSDTHTVYHVTMMKHAGEKNNILTCLLKLIQFASYEENKLEYGCLEHQLPSFKDLSKGSDNVTFITFKECAQLGLLSLTIGWSSVFPSTHTYICTLSSRPVFIPEVLSPDLRLICVFYDRFTSHLKSFKKHPDKVI